MLAVSLEDGLLPSLVWPQMGSSEFYATLSSYCWFMFLFLTFNSHLIHLGEVCN